MMMIMMRILLLGIHGPFMHQWATTTFANSIELIHAPLVNQFGQNEPSHGLATISPSRNMTHPAFLPSCHPVIQPSIHPIILLAFCNHLVPWRRCGRLIIGFTYTSVPQISLEGYAYASHESRIASQSTMWICGRWTH